ncbi:MAG TPA: 30S ribosomal protein S20 [Rhodospirillales bacterium]|jgi:small subunit ribosomal protein S20|nr:30S ribosomal protein S20 [Rhodospirillales bacterium]HJO69419.1 30S ribosomal protein S20 [Rhodospirillales bacterium]
MANYPSAKKRIRRDQRRTIINHARMSRTRTFVRKVENAIENGDRALASVAFREAQPYLMSSVNKGLVHRNTAARRLSRLSARIKAMPA